MLQGLKHPRYMLFLGVLALGVCVFLLFLPSAQAVIAAFDLAVAAFVLSCVPLWHGGNPDEIRRQAGRDDAGQLLLLVLTGLISTAVLVTLAILALGKSELGVWGTTLLVGTLMASWTFANLIYAFHYARLYYSPRGKGDHEGLDFPGGSKPDFADFVNFAFVIGMTCQTADITITHSRIRRISTFHGLFAFAFNLGILALTVNMLAANG